MDFKDLTPEQREKAMACESAEELVKLAEEFGVVLSEEQLDALSGGFDWGDCKNNKCTKDFVW